MMTMTPQLRNATARKLTFGTICLIVLTLCSWGSFALGTEYPAGNGAALGTAITSATTAGDRIKLTGDITDGTTYTLSSSGIILDGTKADGTNTEYGSGSKATSPFDIALGTDGIKIQNITFKGNATEKYDGGVFIVRGKNLTLSGVVFENNKADFGASPGSGVGGGALCITGGFGPEEKNHDFTGTRFIRNTAAQSLGLDPSLGGGAVYIDNGAKMNFSDTVFEGNNAGSHGGAVAGAGGAGTTKELDFTRATFSSNTAIEEGGAVAFWGLSNSVFRDTVFENNSSTNSQGGALYLHNGDTIDLTNAQFTENKARGQGGGVSLYESVKVDGTGAVFKGNTAGADGGGLAVNYGSRLILRDAVFQENKSSAAGGGAYLFGFLSTVDFTGATFDRNTAPLGGGLKIGLNVSNVILSDVTFTGNVAESPVAGLGGAIHTEVPITIGGNSRFEGNTAKTQGGAILLESADLTLNPGLNQKVEFVTPTDTIAGAGNIYKTGKGTVIYGGSVTLVGDMRVREGEMTVADNTTIISSNFYLDAGATLGLTLSGLNNAIIKLNSGSGGKGEMANGSTVRAKLMGDAANLQAGQSVDVAVLDGATRSTDADFDPTIAIDNLLFTASGKFANDTWYITLTRHSIVDPPVPPDPPDIIDPPVPPIPPVTPPIPPDIGGSVDDDYKPGDNPWLDDVLEGKPEEVPRAVLSGVTLPSLIHTFFILQDISGVMRNASFQGPEWARRNGGKIWGDERGSLWAAPFYLRDKTRNMSTRYGYKTGYDLHLGGGIAGINRNAADDTATFGGLVALGAGRLTSKGDFLRTSNATQFFASSVYGEWRPEAMKGALRLGVRGGITSTENSMHQAGPAPLRAKIYARAWQLDLYAEHRKVWDEWEMRTSVGAGAVWYYRPSFNAKSPSHSLDPAEASRDVDVAEYGQSRELTVRIPVRVTVSRRIATDSGTVTPEVYVGYQPVLGDRSEDYTWKLMNGTHPVKVYGPQLDRHTATAGASLVWQKENIRAALSWDAEFSRHRRSHAIGLSFAWEF